MAFFEALKNFFVHNGYTFELLAATSMFVWPLKRRNRIVLRFLLSFGFLLGFSLLWNFIGMEKTIVTETVRYILLLAIAALGIFACFDTSWWRVVSCTVCACATQHMTFKIVSIILSLTGIGYDTVIAAVVNFVMIIVMYATVLFTLGKRIRLIADEYCASRTNIVISFCVIVFAVIFNIIVDDQLDMFARRLLFFVVSAYDLFCCIFAIFLQYGLFENRKLSGDAAVLKHLVHKQEEQYRMTKESMDMVNIKCHDMKHQISRLNGRIDPDELERIREAIAIYDTSLKTGNEVLDILLTEKNLLCEKDGINLDCIVDGKSLLFMSVADIYSLFGNALDNAIEAQKSVADKEKRYIGLRVKRRLNAITIHIENSFEGALDLAGGGLPRTTKGDENYHGYGMRSIRMIAEKYGGNMTFFTEDNVFNLNVMLFARAGDKAE